MSKRRPPRPDSPRCGAKRRNGEPCRQWPLAGTNRCRLHGGASPQAQRKARERIIAATDVAAGRLIEFMNDPRVPWAIRLAAARDLLDRGGVSARTVVEVDAPWQQLITEVVIISDDAARPEVTAPAVPVPAALTADDQRIEVAGLDPGEILDAEIVDEPEPEPPREGSANPPRRLRLALPTGESVRWSS